MDFSSSVGLFLQDCDTVSIEQIMNGSYWGRDQLIINSLLIMHLLGAFCLGLVMGYERAYRGRAAGMRTYAFVCMASAALTIIMGYPEYWFGTKAVWGFADPSRVIQGIVTGLGFLGAGVIMKDEHRNIRGLSTAGSLWVASAVGILIGLGFYLVALFMALLTTLSLAGVGMLQQLLPTKLTVQVHLFGKPNSHWNEEQLRLALAQQGFKLQAESITLRQTRTELEWSFLAETNNQTSVTYAQRMTAALNTLAGMTGFAVNPTRN